MKKVLLISSSPRKNGNSDLLCDQFRKGAIDAGHRAEKIFLAEKKIHYCTGCGACADATRPCVQKDDVAEILEKMVGSGCHRPGDTGLFLYDVRPAENPDRPELSALHGNLE